MGNRDIEDSLERLDKLTQEEARMSSAELLKMTHGVDGKVMGVDDRVKGVEGKMQVIRENVQDVRDDMQGVRDNMQSVGNDVQDVCVNMRDVGDKVQDVDDRVQDIGKDISIKVQGVDDKLDQANRSLFLFTLSHHPDGSNNVAGNQLRDNLLQWLSPRDPSTNHNIASKARHNGTADWFFRSNVFSQWKSTGSFLWINGKCALNLAFTLRQPLIVPFFHSGVREKCSLVRLSFASFHPCETDIVISVPRSYKIS